MNYKFIKRVISIVLVTAISLCTFARDVHAAASVENINRDALAGSEAALMQGQDYVEVKLSQPGESPLNEDEIINQVDNDDDESFFVDALDAMVQKAENAKQATLTMRNSERTVFENGRKMEGWEEVRITKDCDEGLELKDKTVYFIDGDITISNKNAPEKDVISISENALVHIEVADKQSLTIDNCGGKMAAMSLPMTSALVIYGSHDEHSRYNVNVRGSIVDKNRDMSKFSKLDSGSIFLLDDANFSSTVKHTGLIIAHFLSVITNCDNVQYADCSLNDNGTVKHLDCEIVDDLPTLEVQNNHMYYITRDMDYTADTGKNGITIPENSTVLIGITQGTTVNINGGAGNAELGAGAGINVPESSRLILMGEGTLNVKGGSPIDGSECGPSAAIGGRGCLKDGKGQNCGEIYIMDKLKVSAEAGTPKLDFISCDYGIGGGAGAGLKNNGINGEVYIDYEAKVLSGRDYFYHYVDVTVQASFEDVKTGEVVKNIKDYLNGEETNLGPRYEPIVRGNNELIFTHKLQGDIDYKTLYIAFKEARNRGALVEGENGFQIVNYEDFGEQNEHCDGAYRTANWTWNKHFIDNSGGYFYIFAVVLGEVAQRSYYDGDHPYRLCFDLRELFYKEYQEEDHDSMYSMFQILFIDHYHDPFHNYEPNYAYTIESPTPDYTYTNVDDALNPINKTIITVQDKDTARYCTMSYDTERVVVADGYIYDTYAYKMTGGSFKCIDGYKGVNSKNWMHFLPDNASIDQVNMPGTHDAGTFNMHHSSESTIAMATSYLNLLITYIPWYVFTILAILHLVNIELAVAVDLIIELAPTLISPILEEGVGIIAKCQDFTIKQQLENGIRVLDVRIAYNRDHEDGEKDPKKLLRVVHGTVKDLPIEGIIQPEDKDVILGEGYTADGRLLTVDEVINDCKSFLSEGVSKDESIVLLMQVEGSVEENIKDSDLNKTLKSFYEEINKDGDNLFQLKEGDKIPTVGDSKGRIYIISSDDYLTFDNVTPPSSWDVDAQEKIKYLKAVFDQAASLPQEYGKTMQINKEFFNPKVIFASTYDLGWEFAGILNGEYGVNGTPRQLAKIVNKYCEDYVYTRGQHYGWILFNFPTDFTSAKIYYSNKFDIDKLLRSKAEEPQDGNLHVYGLEDKEYTGKKIVQNLKIFTNGHLINEGTDYKLTYTDNINAGTANIKITCKGNYSGEANITFNILPKDMGKLEVNHIDCVNVPKSGKTVKILKDVKDGKKVLKATGKDYSVQYLNVADGSEVSLKDIPVGTYKMVVSGCNNYAGKYESDFTVVTKDTIIMSKAKIALTKNAVTYGNSELPKVKSIKIGGKTYTENGTNKISDMFNVSYPVNGGTVGKHVIIISAKAGNEAKLAGSKQVKYNVNKIKLNKSMFKVSGTYVYNGLPVNPTIETELKKDRDYEVSINGGNKAGKAYAVFKGAGNYTGGVKVAFTIGKCDLSGVSISVNGISDYNKAGAKANFTAKVGGIILSQGRDYTISYQNNKKLGTATATLKGKGSFKGSNSINFEIGKAPIDSEEILVNVKDVVYANNKTTYKPTVTVKQSGKALKNNTDFTVIYENDGTVTEQDMAQGYKEINVTVKAADNSCYVGERTEKFTVYLKGREVSKITGTVADQIYNGKAVTVSANSISLKDKDGNVIQEDDISIISYKNNIKVGNKASVSFKVKGYGGLKTLKFKILPKKVNK